MIGVRALSFLDFGDTKYKNLHLLMHEQQDEPQTYYRSFNTLLNNE